ncbi:GNAT family N-acetyltransferase [Paenibacillus castaneae]|uniref:GNAT family N-acetyltransferase n=1 Tax=Paenibacillus castaneae TaxID=474957 RepID=UPI000C9CB01D|nr:GNAT family N-acetyltransferase [Paenibacillus castaneae]
MLVPDDYETVARIMSGHYSEAVTVQKMMEEDALIPAKGSLSRDENDRLTGHDRVRLIAENSEGQIVGYGHAWRAPWSPPGVLYEQIIVDAQQRGRGTGQEMFEALMAYTHEVRANRIFCEVRDDEPESVAFAAAREFKTERHLFESVIELAEPASAGIEQLSRPTNSRIRFAALTDLPGEEIERQLFELYRTTHPDIPGFEGEYMWYSEWRKRKVDRTDFDSSLVLLALDEERIVGAVELMVFEDSQSVYNDYTCVDAAYRGQGIALALKIRSIEEARRRGFRYIRTNNDSLNIPMLTINRKLGYKPVPGYYQMICSV